MLKIFPLRPTRRCTKIGLPGDSRTIAKHANRITGPVTIRPNTANAMSNMRLIGEAAARPLSSVLIDLNEPCWSKVSEIGVKDSTVNGIGNGSRLGVALVNRLFATEYTL